MAPSLSGVERLSDRLSAGYLEYYGLLPLERQDNLLRVGSWHEQPDPQALDDLRLLFDCEVVLQRFEEDDLRSAIRRAYTVGALTAEGVIASMTDITQINASELALDDLVHLANEAPVVKLVNLLLLEALEARASDVHLEGFNGSQSVRYRIDGILQDAPSPPSHLSAAVVSRLKIMADLDIAERRIPQDGRIRLKLQDRQVDVRVSTIPTLHGESVVLRLLDREGRRGSLSDLGMSGELLAQFRQAISRPHGIILATGPTGSGKTTTLYAAIEQLRTGREKILTVEDPVEYELPGIPQMPVHEKVGVTFASALRAMLRQDPDVMLVGEIRDGETAEIATQAALTGHLVLSTLHTNDAPGAITRLIDLGVAPFLVASTVEAVLAQRLVRQVCATCARPLQDRTMWETKLGAALGNALQGVGCPECRQTGYRGRTGIYEMMLVSSELRREIAAGTDQDRLTEVASRAGIRSLFDDAIRLVRTGVTTPEEVLRTIPPRGKGGRIAEGERQSAASIRA
jgi:general secretion pathway protein E